MTFRKSSRYTLYRPDEVPNNNIIVLRGGSPIDKARNDD